MSAPPAPPLLLASTSPQRRLILEQLGIPFDVVAPDYEERDDGSADAVVMVKEHARGKARSVAESAGERPVLGVDTAVVLGGRVYGKPRDAGDAERMLEALSGRRHAVISGLCLVAPARSRVRKPRWSTIDPTVPPFPSPVRNPTKTPGNAANSSGPTFRIRHVAHVICGPASC